MMTRLLLSLLIGAVTIAPTAISQAFAADEFVVNQLEFPVMKSVFGEVQSRDIVPARARIGGTIVDILVEEGDSVAAGEIIANVADQKLALRLEAIEARKSAVEAQLDNARSNLARAKRLFDRGAIAKTRLDDLQTQVDVRENEQSALAAEIAVVLRQSEEGMVTAPFSGRILSVPVANGSVILPGETIARVAGGGFFLRLSLPERHTAGIAAGNAVIVSARGLPAHSDAPVMISGKIAKVYPEISDGRVIADVEVDGLGDYFVGERILVSIPVGVRQTIAVPEYAVTTRHGIDYVSVRREDEIVSVIVVLGQQLTTGSGELREVLTGLKVGDKVLLR